MKKTLLLLLVLASVANAAPRFGIIAEQTAGAGAFITDDMYNAQVTFGSETVKRDTASTEIASSAIKLGGNYKIALDSVTALTIGVNYTIGNSDIAGFDSNTTLAISAGYERALSSNIVLTTQADIYSQNVAKAETGTAYATAITDTEVTTTSLLANGRVGVAYLF